MKEDELEELRELNRHLQTLLKEKDENANILRRNNNVNRYLLLTKSIKNLRNYLNSRVSLDLAGKVEDSKRQTRRRDGRSKCKSNRISLFYTNYVSLFQPDIHLIVSPAVLVFRVHGGPAESGAG